MSAHDLEGGHSTKNAYIQADDVYSVVHNYVSRKSAEELDHIEAQGGNCPRLAQIWLNK